MSHQILPTVTDVIELLDSYAPTRRVALVTGGNVVAHSLKAEDEDGSVVLSWHAVTSEAELPSVDEVRRELAYFEGGSPIFVMSFGGRLRLPLCVFPELPTDIVCLGDSPDRPS